MLDQQCCFATAVSSLHSTICSSAVVHCRAALPGLKPGVLLLCSNAAATTVSVSAAGWPLLLAHSPAAGELLLQHCRVCCADRLCPSRPVSLFSCNSSLALLGRKVTLLHYAHQTFNNKGAPKA